MKKSELKTLLKNAERCAADYEEMIGSLNEEIRKLNKEVVAWKNLAKRLGKPC